MRKHRISNQSPEGKPSGLSGAATRIRTGDLILTKDVLYQLSHSSIPQEYFLVTQIIISNKNGFVNTFYKKYFFSTKNNSKKLLTKPQKFARIYEHLFGALAQLVRATGS